MVKGPAKVKVSTLTPKKTLFSINRNSIDVDNVADCTCHEGNSRVRGTPAKNRPVNVHYHCRHCDQCVTYSKSHVIRHEVMVHSVRHPNLNIIECPICAKLFIHVSEYHRHVRMHSAKTRDPNVRAIVMAEDSKVEALMVKVVRPPDPEFRVKKELKGNLASVKKELMSGLQQTTKYNFSPRRSFGDNSVEGSQMRPISLLDDREMPVLTPAILPSTEVRPVSNMEHLEMPILTPSPLKESFFIRYCRDNTLMCDINGCQWKMVLATEIKEHVWWAHGIHLNKLQGYCDKCTESFSQLCNLLSHLQQKHGVVHNVKLERMDPSEQEVNRVNIPTINRPPPVLQSDINLQPQGGLLIRPDRDPNIKTIQFHPDQNLHCHIGQCNFFVNILSEMRGHVKFHHKERVKFQKGLCRMCQYAPNKYKNFEKHLRNKHNVEPGDIGLEKESPGAVAGENKNQTSKANEIEGVNPNTLPESGNGTIVISSQARNAEGNTKLPYSDESTRTVAVPVSSTSKVLESQAGLESTGVSGQGTGLLQDSSKHVEKHFEQQETNAQPANIIPASGALTAQNKLKSPAANFVPPEFKPCIQFKGDGSVYCHVDNCIFGARVLNDLKTHVADFHGENIRSLRAYCCVCSTPFSRFASFPVHLQSKHSVQLGHGGDDMIWDNQDEASDGATSAKISLPANSSHINISMQRDSKMYCHIDHCNFSCSALDDLKHHVRKHGKAVTDLQAFCKLCEIMYSKYPSFTRHVMWKHSVDMYNDSQKVTVRLPTDGSALCGSLQDDGQLYCHINNCNFVAVVLDELRQHFVGVHGKAIKDLIGFYCPMCDFVYSMFSSFKQHIVWKHAVENYHDDDSSRVLPASGPVGQRNYVTATSPAGGSWMNPSVSTNNFGMWGIPGTIIPSSNSTGSRTIRFKHDYRIHCPNENCFFSAVISFEMAQHVRAHGLVLSHLKGYCEICGSQNSNIYSFMSHIRQKHGVQTNYALAGNSPVPFTMPQLIHKPEFESHGHAETTATLRFKLNNRIHCYNEKCTFSATVTNDMTIHLKTVHGLTLQKVQGFCEVCQIYNNRASNFFTHLRQKHSVQTGERGYGTARFAPMDPDENQLDEGTIQNVAFPGKETSKFGIFHPEMIHTDEPLYNYWESESDDEVSKTTVAPGGPIFYEEDGLHCFDESCKFVGKVLSDIKLHLRDVHEKLIKDLGGICELCGETFKSYQLFKKHLVDEHDVEVGKIAESRENLQKLAESSISNVNSPKTQEITQKQTQNQGQQSGEGRISCRQDKKLHCEFGKCNFETKFLIKAREHVSAVHGVTEMQGYCQVCDIPHAKYARFKQHAVSKHSIEMGIPGAYSFPTNEAEKPAENTKIEEKKKVPELRTPSPVKSHLIPGNFHKTSLVPVVTACPTGESYNLPGQELPVQAAKPSLFIHFKEDNNLYCLFSGCNFKSSVHSELRMHIQSAHGAYLRSIHAVCKICNSEHTYKDFIFHLKSKHGVETGWTGRESVVFTISVHNKTKAYCGGCGKKIRFREGRKDVLKEHITKFHKVSLAYLMYFCQACGTKTMNYHTFKLHLLQKKHRANYVDEIKKKIPEDKPSRDFLNTLELRRLPVTVKESREEILGHAPKKVEIICHQENIFECQMCRKIFPGIKYINEHIADWHPSNDIAYHCKLCNLKQANRKDFFCHLSSVLHKIAVHEEDASEEEEEALSEDDGNEPEHPNQASSSLISELVSNAMRNVSASLSGTPPGVPNSGLKLNTTNLLGQPTPNAPFAKQQINIPKRFQEREVDKDYAPKELFPMKKKGLSKVYFGVDGKIHCGHCSFEQTIEMHMRNHLIQVHKERLSFAFCICELCSQCYNSYFPFKYHIGKCHGIRESEDMESPMPSIKIDVTEKGLIRCTRCQFTDVEPQYVRNHVADAHKIKQVYMQFECSLCKMTTSQYNNFVSHLSFPKHKKTLEHKAYGDDVANLNDIAGENVQTVKGRTESNTGPLISTKTNGTTDTSAVRGVHTPKVYSKSIKYMCKECPSPAFFSSIDDLMKHKKVVHSNNTATFRCKSCNLNMQTYKEFMDHIHSVHQGGKVKMAKPENASAKIQNMRSSSAASATKAKELSNKEATEAGNEEKSLTGKPPKEINNAGGNPEGEKTPLPSHTKTTDIPPVSLTEIQSCELQTVIIPQFKSKTIQKPVVLEQTSSKGKPEMDQKESSLSQLQTSNTAKISSKSLVQKTNVDDEQKGVSQMPARSAKRKMGDDDKENVDLLADEVTEVDVADEVPKVDKPVQAEKVQLVANHEKSLINTTHPTCKCLCNICKLHFVNMRDFERHLVTTHPGIQPIVTCRLCKLRFRTKRSLLKHVNSDDHQRKVKLAEVDMTERSSKHS